MFLSRAIEIHMMVYTSTANISYLVAMNPADETIENLAEFFQASQASGIISIFRCNETFAACVSLMMCGLDVTGCVPMSTLNYA